MQLSLTDVKTDILINTLQKLFSFKFPLIWVLTDLSRIYTIIPIIEYFCEDSVKKQKIEMLYKYSIFSVILSFKLY